MPKLDSLEPDFKEKIQSLLAAAEEKTGRKWVVTSCRRTMKEQQGLYDQGRSLPGNIVTNARPGTSAHNFGLAADLAPLKENGNIDWNAPHDVWEDMGRIAEALGLTWGGRFRTIIDLPHVEDKTWKLAQGEWKAGRLVIA